MPTLSVQISRFVSEDFPGFVECVLIDVSGQSHLFVEKAPVVSNENLWSTSTYPCRGEIGCEVEAEWIDGSGREISRVTTERPWDVQSTSGESQFVVLRTQVVHS